MARIVINDEEPVNGRLTVTRSLVESEDGTKFIHTEGLLATHFYFEELDAIETERFRLDLVSVVEEIFGSDDYEIIYKFHIGKFEIKGGLSPYSDDKITEIDSEMYEVSGEVKNNVR